MTDLQERAAAKQPNQAYRLLRHLQTSTELWLCIDDLEDRTSNAPDGSTVSTVMVALVFAGLVIKSDDRVAVSRLGNSAHGYVLSPLGEVIADAPAADAMRFLCAIYERYNALKLERARALAEAKEEWDATMAQALKQIAAGAVLL